MANDFEAIQRRRARIAGVLFLAIHNA